MPKYPVSKPKEVISALKRMGFEDVRISGSHIHLRKNQNFVTVPYHNRDLKIKTLKSIIQQAGITVDELRKYL
ncbi:MAG: type II toxin-antitoxin system HicA family toxin [Ignavibacteria bacterium]|nr:type II toxin-antitoxin system HicA family toxin [Ignavibacteria bacterium]MCC7158457.1 type II toxin-antitoxin system HicA family toxin [Ignavibacteria bacterium]